MLTPREKSPLPENVPRRVSNPRHFGSEPKHYQLSYSGPAKQGSKHVEVSAFTPQAMGGKTFRRLTKEKATITGEIDKGKNCWNFTWLEENVLVPVSWERKPEEHSLCVGDCIDPDRDRFTAKGVLKSVYRYGQLRYRHGQLRFIWQEEASSTEWYIAFCLQR